MDAARMRMQQQHENMAEKFSEEEKKVFITAKPEIIY